MDGLIPAGLCDVPFFLQTLEGLLFLFFVGFFFEGDEFLGGRNSLFVAIIIHDQCSNQSVGIHL